jgi:hypothetical protein
MAYGGAVNLGGFGIFPAMPFLIGLIIFGLRAGHPYRLITVVVVLMCGSLWGLKHQQTFVFQPALGDEVSLSVPVCYQRYTGYSREPEQLNLRVEAKGRCYKDNSMVETLGSFPVGKTFTINEIRVSHSDFGEHYGVILDSEHGPVSVVQIGKGILIKSNGDPLKESDLRRGVFYYPSLLMYYALLPIIILSAF